MKYIFFDLDGTLCKSRTKIEDDMLLVLDQLSWTRSIIIVSGAELGRMFLQAPLTNITFMAQNGNEVYEDKRVVWTNTFNSKDKVHDHIAVVAKELGVKVTDEKVDDRGAQISFSFVGHNAPTEEKNKFDLDRKKRIALLEKFPFNGAVIGGTTCIDYVPYTKGDNIRRYLEEKEIDPVDCLYIGDAFINHGNDSTVCGVIPTFEVRGPEDTLKFIKQL